MWSKRTETRKHNMTSFKSKITRRKRKLSNSGINNIQFLATQFGLDGVVPLLENNIVVNASGMPNKRKSDPARFYVLEERAAPETNGSAQEPKTTVNSGQAVNLADGGPADERRDSFDNSEIECVNWTNGCDVPNVDCTDNCDVDVIASEAKSDGIQMRLRTGDSHGNSHSSVRYSDSYVASKNTRDKNYDSANVLKKSRSVYGDSFGSVYDNSVTSENFATKYKPGNSSLYRSRQKQSASTPAADTKMQLSARQLNDAADKQPKNNDGGAENKRSGKNKKKNAKSKQLNVDYNESNLSKTVVNSAAQKTEAHGPITDDKKNKKTVKDSTNNDSYLKRVKSKIYKHSRSDSSVSQISTDSLPDVDPKSKPKKMKEKKSQVKQSKIPKICEDIEETVSDIKLKKSASTLFLRQYSNLERVRPRTFGVKNNPFMGISDLVDSTTNILNVPLEQPKLTKSKSSSAINLNLLRSRRNKIQEQSKNCKNADTEFSFIAYGASGGVLQNQSVTVTRKFGNRCSTDGSLIPQKERPSSWMFGGGDRQPGQPVSRSSSDKRPDAVSEEVSKSSEPPDVEPDTDISHDNVHNVPRARSSQPGINRSESYKEQSQKRRQIRERRKISDPNLSKSNDLDSDHQELSYHSGSSSNSSLSSRSSESPQSTSLDTVPGSHAHGTTTALDSDMEIEPDPPDWQSSVPEEVLSRLHPEEKKRQEIINELFHTERSHVRNLRVLETVFYRPLLNYKHLPPDQVSLLFSNLEEMLEIHGAFNAAMKARRKEGAVISDIGELLLNMFDGPAGENFQRAAATFCARQQLALESLKELRKKDTRLHMFLKDCESDRLCKRFQLKDIIPTGMQRLVKYPLLFESLVKCTERLHDSTMRESLPTSTPGAPVTPAGPTEELNRLRRAVERSKEILNYVNRAVKEAEDNARLQDIQKRLDKTAFEKMEHPVTVEFRNMDLTKHKLIHEGPLMWRINKQKFNLHVLLTEEIIVLLQKQDEKYVLKFYNSMGGGERPHSPVIKVSALLVRPNAAAKDSLFLVNTSHNGAQIYDLVAPSPSDSKIWFKHISDAAEAYKCREGKSRRSELSTPESEGADTSSADPAGGDADKSELLAGGDLTSGVDAQSGSGADTDSNATSGESSQRNSGVIEDEPDKRLSQGEPDSSSHSGTEQVRRKDEAIRQALAEKEALVAEILDVPPEEYHMIVDMAGDNITGDKEPTELVLAAVNQANQLWSVVSESLNISDVDTVLATSSQNPSCTSSPPKNSYNALPSVPSHRIQDIASTLNSQLTALLKAVKEREDERERMRRELQKLREQIHIMHGAQLRLAGSLCSDTEHTGEGDASYETGDLANIEEDP